jgi:hypothetical protein
MTSQAGKFCTPRQTEADDLASMADWNDMQDLDISGEPTNVVIATKYPNLVLKSFHNHGSSAATILGTTQYNSTFTLVIPVGGFSGKLPSVKTLTQSGTSDGLTLFFQRTAD